MFKAQHGPLESATTIQGPQEAGPGKNQQLLTKQTFLQGCLAGVWHFPIQLFTVLPPSLPNISKQ